MSPALDLLRKLAGLFFDDGSLAIAILVVLAATAILINAAWLSGPLNGPVTMAFLVGGVSAALVENVVRMATVPRHKD